MRYDASKLKDRKELAEKLSEALTKAGFSKISSENTEDVFALEIKQSPGVRIKVYSSIKDGAIRAKGADAIRVHVTYKRHDGSEMPILNESPVHRTGELEDIVHRTLDRARGAWIRFKERHQARLYCQCSAPLCVSKLGKNFCGETCWK